MQLPRRSTKVWREELRGCEELIFSWPGTRVMVMTPLAWSNSLQRLTIAASDGLDRPSDSS